MSSITIFFIFVNFILLIFFTKLIFKTFKEFKRCLFYLWMPDIVSIAYKKYDEDFKYTYKFLLLLIIMFAICLIEYKLFY